MAEFNQSPTREVLALTRTGRFCNRQYLQIRAHAAAVEPLKVGAVHLADTLFLYTADYSRRFL